MMGSKRRSSLQSISHNTTRGALCTFITTPLTSIHCFRGDNASGLRGLPQNEFAELQLGHWDGCNWSLKFGADPQINRDYMKPDMTSVFVKRSIIPQYDLTFQFAFTAREPGTPGSYEVVGWIQHPRAQRSTPSCVCLGPSA